MNAPRPLPFDLFVSYAHKDDQGEHAGKVTALDEAIRARHAETFPNDPLNIFFDTEPESIGYGDHWKEKILAGLEQSAVMVAILSPAYFKSEWCRREWETFTQLELQRTYPGEAISPIYVLQHPDFDANESQLLDAWLKDLKQRQYVVLLPYFPDGAAALAKREVRARLNELHDRAWERVKKVRLFRRQPWNVPTERNQIFVGREDDLQKVNERLMRFQTVGVTAVSGFGGIGKTTLAFRYAQRFRDHYPGGVLYLACDTMTQPADLFTRLLDLAPHLFRWPDMSDAERAAAELLLADLAQLRKQSEERAYQQLKAHLEAGAPKLLIFDNVSNPAVLGASARKLLPAPQNVRQLFTTRLGATDLGGLDTVPLGLLDTADALELLCRWRSFARDLNDPAYKDACQDEAMIDEDAILSPLLPGEGSGVRDDAEWKAALAIVNRVQRLTIAVEVIGVHLSLHPEITFTAFLAGMKRKGIGAKLNDAGRDAKVKQWITHPETLMGPLFEPTLLTLPPLALRTLEYAAFLPKDHLAIDWLRSLVEQDADTRPLLAHDPDDADPWLDALRLLADRQLLHSTPDVAAVFPLGRMHQILQEVLIVRLRNAEASGGRKPPDSCAARELAVLELTKESTFRIDDTGYFTALTGAEFAAVEQTVRRHTASTHHAIAVTKRAMVGPLMNLGRLQSATQYAQQAHHRLHEMASSDRANAAWQRDLWVSHWRVANLMEKQGDANAQQHWRAAHEVLAGMVQAGLHVTQVDRGFLEQLRAKLGG